MIREIKVFRILLLSVTLLMISYGCNENLKSSNNTVIEIRVPKKNFKAAKTLNFSDSIFNRWFNYYKINYPDFSLSNFELQNSKALNIIPGTVYGKFDEEYDSMYNQFLIYNSDSTRYIDIDSYNWSKDEKGQRLNSPDQEINLIDLGSKSVKRIDFVGSNEWVEDAFWENDSTIVLLKNNYDRSPIISKVFVIDSLVVNYQSEVLMDFDSEYSSRRYILKDQQ